MAAFSGVRLASLEVEGERKIGDLRPDLIYGDDLLLPQGDRPVLINGKGSILHDGVEVRDINDLSTAPMASGPTMGARVYSLSYQAPDIFIGHGPGTFDSPEGPMNVVAMEDASEDVQVCFAGSTRKVTRQEPVGTAVPPPLQQSSALR